jgi:hypothetical protein
MKKNERIEINTYFSFNQLCLQSFRCTNSQPKQNRAPIKCKNRLLLLIMEPGN